ncbi:MAG TPA: metalloregulator ArsR/SmtB family transcription factor [Candidatus Binatia bacterium]|nr:metalloregulator ArsR/SmtB family transcription factor [Candidatus Binatia bacterium]
MPSARDEVAAADLVFSALSHASRRHILHVLHLRGGEMTAGEIADRFACSWPTTSRHLKVLERAGLVRVVPRGRERAYHLDRRRLLGVTRGWLQWIGDERGSARR